MSRPEAPLRPIDLARSAGVSTQQIRNYVDAAAGQTPGTLDVPRGALRIGEVAAYLGVRTSALRVWEAAGLLVPKRERGTRYRTYGPADVRDARMIHMLRQDRYPLDRIRP